VLKVDLRLPEPENKELPNANMEKLEPFERWQEEVSAKVKEYETAVAMVRAKLDPMLKRLQDLESSFSEIVEEGSAEAILRGYDKFLRTPIISGVVARETILRPKMQYRRLKAELAKLRDGEKISAEQHKTGLDMLSNFKLVALDLEDEMVSFEQEYRYLESISSAVLNRMRAIRETEAEKQLRALNESLRKMTQRLLIYTVVIAFFTVLNFVATILRW
jgi:uncharacterized coiled-coil protein SlyX